MEWWPRGTETIHISARCNEVVVYCRRQNILRGILDRFTKICFLFFPIPRLCFAIVHPSCRPPLAFSMIVCASGPISQTPCQTHYSISRGCRRQPHKMYSFGRLIKHRKPQEDGAAFSNEAHPPHQNTSTRPKD